MRVNSPELNEGAREQQTLPDLIRARLKRSTSLFRRLTHSNANLVSNEYICDQAWDI